MKLPKLATLALATALLAGCDASDADKTGGVDGTAQQALPAPQAGPGPVTGMPGGPGPGLQASPPPVTTPGADIVFDLPPDPRDNPESGLLPDDPAATADDVATAQGGAGSAQQDAAALVRDYYAAIDAQDHGRAYRLWADEGRSSGQSPGQFANGFAEVAGITVELGSPGPLQATGGGQSITVPVAITASRRDGSVRRYDGTYTLRRYVDPGATPGQRAWRIGAADLRELQ